MLPGPPTLYQTILDHPAVAELRSLVAAPGRDRRGGRPRRADRAHAQASSAFETVITGYGLTETCGIATMCRHDDDPETIATTSGRAIPGARGARASTPRATRCRAGEPGEVLVRGLQRDAGLLRRPRSDRRDDRRRRLAAHRRHRRAWTSAGYLRITDRKKDMFIVGGFNAYPAEIESLMLATRPSPRWRSSACPTSAWARSAWPSSCPARAPAIDPDELIAWSRERMANYKVPRRRARWSTPCPPTPRARCSSTSCGPSPRTVDQGPGSHAGAPRRGDPSGSVVGRQGDISACATADGYRMGTHEGGGGDDVRP